MSLSLPRAPSPSYNFTPTTDQYGQFALAGITPGTYDVRIKNRHTLQNLKAVTLAAGSNTIDFGTLKEGDANDDNSVTLVDFSILATTFGKCQGTTGYDDRPDFNEDDCITLPDFSLLATNFGQIGSASVTIEGTPAEQLLPMGYNVSISIQPALSLVKVGDIFTVAILVQSGSQLVDGAQASLDFDPTKLQVKTITGNTAAFPYVLMNNIDNTNGTVDYAAGTLSNFPSGVINLVYVQFEALSQVQNTPITFHHGKPRDTDVTGGGSSLLTEHTDVEASIYQNINKLYLPVIIQISTMRSSIQFSTIDLTIFNPGSLLPFIIPSMSMVFGATTIIKRSRK